MSYSIPPLSLKRFVASVCLLASLPAIAYEPSFKLDTELGTAGQFSSSFRFNQGLHTCILPNAIIFVQTQQEAIRVVMPYLLNADDHNNSEEAFSKLQNILTNLSHETLNKQPMFQVDGATITIPLSIDSSETLNISLPDLASITKIITSAKSLKDLNDSDIQAVKKELMAQIDAKQKEWESLTLAIKMLNLSYRAELNQVEIVAFKFAHNIEACEHHRDVMDLAEELLNRIFTLRLLSNDITCTTDELQCKQEEFEQVRELLLANLPNSFEETITATLNPSQLQDVSILNLINTLDALREAKIKNAFEIRNLYIAHTLIIPVGLSLDLPKSNQAQEDSETAA